MSWFRKLIVVGALSVGILLPLGVATQAQATPPGRAFHEDHWHHWYTVFYRVNCNSPWLQYGRFHNDDQAQHVVHHLQHQGFEAYVN
jgi:hypothetical protein